MIRFPNRLARSVLALSACTASLTTFAADFSRADEIGAAPAAGVIHIDLTAPAPAEAAVADAVADADNEVQQASGFTLSRPLYLDIGNPAERMRSMQGQPTTAPAEERDTRRAPNFFEGRRPSYDMPAIEVVGERAAELREEDPIGPYGQPRWTARRRFPGTRVYVRPPGTIEFEYWLRPTIESGGNTEIRSLYEISVGLPYRFQLDLYLRTDSGGDGEETEVGQQVELRWALADWNVIWGNPTLYVEWVQKDASPDQVEAKLLLGGEIAPRYHWGVNLVAELETGGEREYEYQFDAGLSYALVDSVLSIGLETQCLFANTRDNRDTYSTAIFVGPSILWSPFEQLHIEFAPLVGVTSDSPTFRAFLIVGWEF